ncbi:MAG: hypothetical protein V3S69_05540, partial [Dehalococcoidales bacterium]
VKQLLPTDKADTLALVNRVGKLLEEPLNSKAAKQLLAETNNDPRVAATITGLQKAAAQAQSQGKTIATPKVKLFQAGSGLYSTTGKGSVTSVPAHQIAVSETVEDTLKRPIKAMKELSPADRELLKEQGFSAIMVGDKVGLL